MPQINTRERCGSWGVLEGLRHAVAGLFEVRASGYPLALLGVWALLSRVYSVRGGAFTVRMTFDAGGKGWRLLGFAIVLRGTRVRVPAVSWRTFAEC